MKNLRNRIDVKLVSNGKDYMSHKIFDNNFAAIRKSKLALELNKPAYIGMCILELRKVLMYEFHYDYITNQNVNKSKILFTDTNSLMYEIQTEDVHEDFSSIKEIFMISVIIRLSQNTMMIQTN